MKNGTSPGPDHLQAELFKNAPAELIELLRIVIERVWTTNIVPADWLTTTQVPLPKISAPKSINDFRRITLSPVIYKIYASYLLSQLQQYIRDIKLTSFAIVLPTITYTLFVASVKRDGEKAYQLTSCHWISTKRLTW